MGLFSAAEELQTSVKMQLRLTLWVNLKGPGAVTEGTSALSPPIPTETQATRSTLHWAGVPAMGTVPETRQELREQMVVLSSCHSLERVCQGARGLLGCDTKSSSCFAQISETAAALREHKKSAVWNTRAQNKDGMTCSKMYFFMSHGLPQLSSLSFCY